MTPIRWVESFRDCALRTFGVRDAPLLYIIRENDDVPTEMEDPLLPERAYGQSGSVVAELIKRMNYSDPLFKSDNGLVYSMLETATRGTIYATIVKPYSRTKDGRSAWKAMISSHVGKDKWENVQREKMSFLMNTKWNGKTYSLEKFTTSHRSAFVQLQEAAQHVNFQLPTEHTRVQYLLDNIVHSDADLRAALASIRINVDGMRDDFEKSVSFLLPVCPFAKSKMQSSRSRNIPQVSSLKNSSESKTGIEFRWYQPQEYAKLNNDQRQELYRWQKSKDGRAQMQKDRQTNKSNTSAMTRKQLKATIKSLETRNNGSSDKNDPSIEDMAANIVKAVIASSKTSELPSENSPPKRKSVAFDDSVNGHSNNDNYKVAAQALQKIIKRNRNNE